MTGWSHGVAVSGSMFRCRSSAQVVFLRGQYWDWCCLTFKELRSLRLMFSLGIPNKPSIEHVRKHHHCEGVAFSSLCRTEEERLSTHSISLDTSKTILTSASNKVSRSCLPLAPVSLF